MKMGVELRAIILLKRRINTSLDRKQPQHVCRKAMDGFEMSTFYIIERLLGDIRHLLIGQTIQGLEISDDSGFIA